MDFLDRLKEFIESHIDLFQFDKPTLSIGLLQNPNDACLRQAPGVTPQIMLDRSKVYNFTFQIYVRHISQHVAVETAGAIEQLLTGMRNGEIVSADESFALIKIDCTTTTNFVEATSQGTAYTAIYNAELEV